MTPEQKEEFATAMADGIQKAHKQESPINPQNIIYSIGVAAVVFVGWSFNRSVEDNSEKLDDVVAVVGELANATKNLQSEQERRGGVIENIDTYSEQSRIKDNQHDTEISSLKRRVDTLEAMEIR